MWAKRSPQYQNKQFTNQAAFSWCIVGSTGVIKNTVPTPKKIHLVLGTIGKFLNNPPEACIVCFPHLPTPQGVLKKICQGICFFTSPDGISDHNQS